MAKGPPRILCCMESAAAELCDASFKGRLPHRCHLVEHYPIPWETHECFRCKRPFNSPPGDGQP